MSGESPPFYALLVGICEYASPDLRTLAGCVNDVEDMAYLLHHRFNVADPNIKKLVNTEATHQAIKDAFHTHLITPARLWAEAGRVGSPPTLLFHFSGHGSQALDESGVEPDGFDETLVPYDSRMEGVYDIKDWELGQLLDELTLYSDNVTVILDCCHSGSGTRDSASLAASSRRCEPDLRSQPTQRPPAPGQARGLSGASDWMDMGKHVLLAGCRDKEESFEHRYAVAGQQQVRVNGALTYFLLAELTQMAPERPLTYRELHERVRSQVNKLYSKQMPQCEGDRERELFGGHRPPTDPFLTVVEKSDGFIWVDGGLAHGLTEGSQLTIYPPGTRRRTEGNAPIATLEVVQEGAVRSGCSPVSGEEIIPLLARALPSRLKYELRQRVALEIADEATRESVRHALQQEETATYVSIVASDEASDLRLVAGPSGLEFVNKVGTRLSPPLATTNLEGLARWLIYYTRYQNALTLRNQDPTSSLAGLVSVALKRLAFDPDTQRPLAVPLSGIEGGEQIIEAGQHLVVEVTNHAAIPLRIAVLSFSSEWEIAILYPSAGVHEALLPNFALPVGLPVQGRRRLPAGLREGEIESRSVIKVIATVDDAEFHLLAQDPTTDPLIPRHAAGRDGRPPTALSLLLEQVHNGHPRFVRQESGQTGDEWTTVQSEVLVVRPPDAETVWADLRGEERVTVPGFELELEAPAGFRGKVALRTARESSRTVGDVTHLQPPRGLAPYQGLIQPLTLSPTRSLGVEGVVLDLETDDAARRLITPQTPLRMHLPSTALSSRSGGGVTGEGIFALAYDGSFFYPVGRSDEAGMVAIEWLPEERPEDETPEHSRRSLGRTTKLYLYKALGWSEPTLGLHRASFVATPDLPLHPPQPAERVQEVKGGEVRYRKLEPGEIKVGHKVALVVHGFQSDTWGIVPPLAAFFNSEGIAYDHLLTFDYESFSTQIADNGKALFNALKEAGLLDPPIPLDLFAHSMGTLVSRYMIEKMGGHQVVQRAFLFGPANRGTELARRKTLVTWLLALLLNQTVPLPARLLLGWAVKRVSDDAVGVADLHPDSMLVKELLLSAQTGIVPYYLLAGRNELSNEAKGVWDHLYRQVSQGADTALDRLFSGHHDKIIGLSSMTALRGVYPEALLHLQEVPCDHFGYYTTPESQAHTLTWLSP